MKTKSPSSRPTMPLTCLLTVSIPHGREEDSARRLLALFVVDDEEEASGGERAGFSSGKGVAVIFLSLRISYSSFFIISSTSRSPPQCGVQKKLKHKKP